MKKILTIILLCCSLLCVCVFSACGESSSTANSTPGEFKESTDPNETTPNSYFRFNLLENGTYEIFARYHDMPNRLVIPSSYNGKSVTKIGDTFGGNTENDCLNRSVEEIVLPNTITEIGKYAFFYYSSLRSVTIPSSVQTIGALSFAGCGELESITIPDGVRSLDQSFYRCTKLVSVTIPASMESFDYSTFGFCESLISITFKGTKAQWNAIEKYSSSNDGLWNRSTGNYTIHCTDGDIAKE